MPRPLVTVTSSPCNCNLVTYQNGSPKCFTITATSAFSRYWRFLSYPIASSSFIIGGQFLIHLRKFLEAAAFDTSGKYIIASSFFLYVRRRNTCSACSFCPLIICLLFLILRKVTKNQADNQTVKEQYRRYDRHCADFSFLVFRKKRAHI